MVLGSGGGGVRVPSLRGMAISKFCGDGRETTVVVVEDDAPGLPPTVVDAATEESATSCAACAIVL